MVYAPSSLPHDLFLEIVGLGRLEPQSEVKKALVGLKDELGSTPCKALQAGLQAFLSLGVPCLSMLF